MTHLNRVFGAHVVTVLTGQYEDPEGQAIYYRIPLGAARARSDVPDASARADAPERSIDMASGLTRPFAEPPASLAAAERSGLLYGPAVNKLTLMNYVTPATVRALEWIGALVPELPHIYLTSSRDETRRQGAAPGPLAPQEAQVAIGLDGGYSATPPRRPLAVRSGGARAARRTSRGRACRTRPRSGSAAAIAALRAARRCRRRRRHGARPSTTSWCRSAPGGPPGDFWPRSPRCATSSSSADRGRDHDAPYRSGRGPFVSPRAPRPRRRWSGGAAARPATCTRARAGWSPSRSRWSRPGTATSCRWCASTTSCAPRAGSTWPAASAALDARWPAPRVERAAAAWGSTASSTPASAPRRSLRRSASAASGSAAGPAVAWHCPRARPGARPRPRALGAPASPDRPRAGDEGASSCRRRSGARVGADPWRGVSRRDHALAAIRSISARKGGGFLARAGARAAAAHLPVLERFDRGCPPSWSGSPRAPG